MHRNLFTLIVFILFMIPLSVFASGKVPTMIVAPFVQTITLSKSTNANVNIVVQNNSGTNLTISNVVPQIPADSSVMVVTSSNDCGFLAPLDTCNVTAQLTGLTKPGNENLNISVCAFNGTLCSRIQQPIAVINAPLVAVSVSPTNPSIDNGTTQQFYATGLYSDNSTQDLTNSVTWSSSDPTKATISNTGSTAGLATGIGAGASTISAAINGLSNSTALTVKSATLSSITIIPANPAIANGTSQQFNAIGIYSDNSYQNITSLVTWNSSNQSVAAIASTGIATGKSIGSTNITAVMGSVTGTANLTVLAATLNSISVTPTNPSSAVGTLQQFTATGIYSDNSTKDLTNIVKWNTGSAIIAIVSNLPASSGLALARNVGTTTVTAKLGSVIGSTNFSVTPATLSSIFVSPTNQGVSAGETQQYSAIGIYTDHRTQDLTNTVTWTSSNTAVSTISNAPFSKGLATSVAVGSTTISAKQNGITGSTTLTVNTAALVSIAVTPAAPTIANGTQQQFTATGTYSDGLTRDLTGVATWVSSSPTIAVISNVVSSQGLATGLAVGSTTIRAIFEGVTGNTTLTVSVATLTSIAVTPANASIPNNTNSQFTATGTYSDASTQDVTRDATWISSNNSVATISNAVSSKGLATGIGVGITTINALLNGITGNTLLSVQSLHIGDNFGGGKIACLEGGLNNLIAASADNSPGLAWQTGGAGTITNAQSDIDGAANTTKIVNVLGAGTNYAAGLCEAYQIDSAGNSPCVGGNTCYNDWFLPAINQLSCVVSNKNILGGFNRVFYWSSTEYSAIPNFSAWLASTYDGSIAAGNKIDPLAVRCVRLIGGTL